jgi:short-subunit dehydrogenase
MKAANPRRHAGGRKLMERPVALITGASSGIGRASAALFAREGYAVVLLARTRERLEAVADAIEARTGSPAMVAPCDVSDRSQVEAAVRAALDRFGRLDVLVANAGVGLYARVEDVPPEEFEALWRTNVMGVLHPVQLAVPPMRAAGRGHIAVVGSVVGKRSWPFHGPYAATKFALTALVQALRAELAGSGVTASLILPGSTRTRFFERSQVVGSYRPRPIGPAQRPSAVARAILRSVRDPKPEVYTVPGFRWAVAAAEAFPFLPDRAAAWWAKRQRRD